MVGPASDAENRSRSLASNFGVQVPTGSFVWTVYVTPCFQLSELEVACMDSTEPAIDTRT